MAKQTNQEDRKQPPGFASDARRPWKSQRKLLSKTSCCAFWCMPCFMCKTVDQFGECLCLPLLDTSFNACGYISVGAIPPISLSMRAAFRERNGIPGSIFNDCCIMYWCNSCGWCQIAREMKARRNAVTVVNASTTVLPHPTYMPQPGYNPQQPYMPPANQMAPYLQK